MDTVIDGKREILLLIEKIQLLFIRMYETNIYSIYFVRYNILIFLLYFNYTLQLIFH